MIFHQSVIFVAENDRLIILIIANHKRRSSAIK